MNYPNLISRIALVTLFVIFGLTSSYSQSGWVRQYPAIQNKDLMTSIYFVNSNTGYAVGTTSLIIKTTNAGVNWFTQPSGIVAVLYSIYFTDPNTGYAAGERVTPNVKGVILKTTNGGEKWVVQTKGVLPGLLPIYFIDSQNGFAAGSVMLQVEMEFLNNYICKLKERKFQNEREETLHSRTESDHSQRAA